jgi:hypothetical protein
MNSRSNAREEFFKEDTQGKKLVVKIIIIQSDSDNLFKKNEAAIDKVILFLNLRFEPIFTYLFISINLIFVK